jgi:hypothetical protein
MEVRGQADYLKSIAIYPLDTDEGVSERIVDIFRIRLETEMVKSKRVNMITRERIDQVIEEQKFQATCSAQECAIQLGDILGADIIVGKLTKIGDVINISIQLLDMKGKILASASPMFEGSDDDLVSKMPLKIATDILNQLSMITVEFLISPSDAIVTLDGETYGKVFKPLDLLPGRHTVSVSKNGYDKYSESFFINAGEEHTSQVFIELDPKRASIARNKSLIFPGLGQLYSADENHLDRRNMGFIFMGTAVATIAGTGATWSGYFQAKTDYDNAYTDYRNQNVIEDINAYREIAEEKNSTMKKSQNTALIMTGLTVGVWIGNALEAYFGFPDYFTMFSNTPSHLGITVAASELAPGPTVGLAWRF